MTMETRTIARWIGAALLLADSIVLAALWMLQPERASRWVTSAAALAIMALLLVVVSRRTTIGKPSAEPIARAIAFAALMLMVSFAASLAGALDVADASELARRGAMVILGVFLASIGNAMPKTLTPLAALQCDPARVQAFQRFAGWTWVLTGLGFAAAWIALPIETARPASVALIVVCMLLIATQLLRLRRTRPRAV